MAQAQRLERRHGPGATGILNTKPRAADPPDRLPIADHDFLRRQVAGIHGHGAAGSVCRYAPPTNHPRNPAPALTWHYDIRETPEDLYDAVLACRIAQDAAAAADLSKPPTDSNRQQPTTEA